jgi:S-(hydroxymethyl)glutathione dehydrogenase/alcohol dehydrogenase
VEYAFEAIGNHETMAQTIMCTRKMGTACIVGQAPDTAILSFPANLLYDERRIIGSNYGSAIPRIDMPRLLDLYLDGKLKLDELVTRTYPLDEINSAFEAMEKGEVARSVIKF